MKIGLQVIEFAWPGGPASIPGTLRDVAVAAEDSGYRSIWVMDHFFQMPGFGGPTAPMLECYCTLGYLAAATQRIELGPLVGGVVYRYPGVLVKTATTLNVLSGGRSWLGLGAAWYQEEAAGLGVPFPSTTERYTLLEDTLKLARHMWSDTAGAPFQGATVTAAQPHNTPPAIRPRILVGGQGERRTLRLVAQYADACNLYAGDTAADFTGPGLARMRRGVEVLHGHCADVGRDPAAIEVTALATVRLDDTGVDDLRRLRDDTAELGVQHLILNLSRGWDVAAVRRIGAALCDGG